MTSADAVVGRLNSLYRDWSGEQALQFTEPGPDGPAPRWFSWGDFGTFADALRSEFDVRGVPTDAAIAVVMRQRPVLVATELAVLSTARAAMLLTPLQSDRSLVDDITT
ncbi:MAG: hypothetical protein ABWZ99_03005, partial [Ilumatobacteraceae bacterium]